MFPAPLPLQCKPMSLADHAPQQVAALIFQSAPSLFKLMFGQQAVEVLTELVQGCHNRYSYRYVRVAEVHPPLPEHPVLGIATLLQTADHGHQADFLTRLNQRQRQRLTWLNPLLRLVLQQDYPDGSMYLANLAVHPDYRGQGIGTQLLQFCIAEAIAAEATALFISVDIHNPRAQKLYEALGFQVIAVKTLPFLPISVGSRVLVLPLR